MPSRLVAATDKNRLLVGICYSNGDRRKAVRDLVNKIGDRCAGIEELCLSRREFFSKWSKDSPIEFFNTQMRFSWYIPIGPQEQAEETNSSEDYQMEMLNFWDSFLSDDTPIYHNSTHLIYTWKSLKDAIFGEKAYMEPSRFVQGTQEKR